MKEQEKELDEIRKNLEYKIEESTKNLKKAYEIAHLGSWEWNVTEDQTIWSDQLYKIFGYKSQEVKASYELYLSLIHPQSLDLFMNLTKSVLINKKSYREQYKLLLRNKKILYVEERGEVELNDNGDVIKLFGTIQDITEQKTIELSLLEKEKQLLTQSRMAQMGEMISMIAHQWRQPLGAISTTTADLEIKIDLKSFDLDTKEGQEQQAIYYLSQLKNIGEYVNNLTNTIDDFRNFYKPNKASISIKFEDIIQKSLGVIQASLLYDRIRIKYNYNSEVKIMMHDREMMQVVLNLLKNSQDNFNEKKTLNPQITIITEEKILLICDNGGGISEDILEKIFNPYFSTKTEKNGTGLGLYMAKTIVQEHHGGVLKVENTLHGVCFTIDLSSRKNINNEAGIL